MFSDALPDRWGRALINRREQILAKEEKRPVRRLSSFDYLVGIEDYSRMGGLRFKDSLDGEYINASEVLRIPPLTDIRELIAASSEIEKVKRRTTCLKDAGSSSLYNRVPPLAGHVQRQA